MPPGGQGRWQPEPAAGAPASFAGCARSSPTLVYGVRGAVACARGCRLQLLELLAMRLPGPPGYLSTSWSCCPCYAAVPAARTRRYAALAADAMHQSKFNAMHQAACYSCILILSQWVPSGTSASVADLLHMEHVKWY